MSEEVRFIFSMDDQFSDQAKQAEKQAGILETKLNTIGAVVVGAFSVGAIVNFGKAVVDSYGKMELFKSSLTTMLRGNGAEAEALNTRLIEIAKTTPFELTEVQDATKQLIAFGSEAGQVGDEIITLGNVAAGIGAPIKDIAYLYGTIRTQGRAMTVDINQFANRGIPIWKELEKITGRTGIALRKYVEEGKVGFPQIQQVMANLTKEGGQFFNLMETQSKTVAGQVSNLGDAWEQLKVSIGESQSGIIKSTLNFATRLVNDLGEVMAMENKLEKRLNKGGAKTYGFFEKRFNQEEYDASLALSDSWDNAIKKASNSELALLKLKKQSAQGISGLIDQRSLGKIDQEDYMRTLAIVKGAQEDIQGNLDLLKSKKAGDAQSKMADKVEKPKSEASKLKTPQYTQINIDINEMIHEYKVTTQNSTELPIITAEHIVKAMVQAVTDAQIVAGM